MKKIVFCLLAIGMTTFANASNVKIEPVKPLPIKKELKLKVKKTETKLTKEDVVKDDELKTVTCWGWNAQNVFTSYSYSCFFCWGGSNNGCMSEGGLSAD